MRRSIVVLALVAALSAPAAAQTLQLDPMPPPPALAENNATRALATALRDEIHVIEAKKAEADREKLVNDVRAQLRRIALDLLVRGTEPGGTHDALAMQGFRLADVRRRIDVLLAGFVDNTLTVGDPPRPLGVRERDVAQRRLQRFLDVAPKALAAASLDDATQVDAAIAAAVAPLCDAIATLEGQPSGESLGSGWPTVEEVNALNSATPSTSAPAPAAEPDPCDPQRRAAAPPQVAVAVTDRCTGIDAIDAPTLATALDLAIAAASCPWLTDEERTAIDEDAARLVRGEVADRELRAAQAALLVAERELAAQKRLAEGGDIDRKDLEATLRRAIFPHRFPDVALADEPARLTLVIRRVTTALELATRFRSRAVADDALPRDLRPMRRDFERAYRRSEATTFARLGALLTDDQALSKPELVALTQGQRDALADLDRLNDTRRLIDAIGGARPQAAKAVTAHVRTMLRWLLEPTRRSAGLLSFDALERQVALFAPLPFEYELRRETPEAIAFAAGEPRKLADAIDAARGEWADAWGEGEGSGDAARRMLRLYRLMRLMSDLAESATPSAVTSESRDAVATLSRWGGIHATRASLAPALVDLGATTKLAALAAIGREDATLERELKRIERDAPLVRLVSRLLDTLGPWLATRPSRATGVLAAIRVPPPDGAWGAALRPKLAAIARFARELDHARRSGDAKHEAAILEYLARLAGSTLEALGAERSPVPELPQFVEPTGTGRRDRQ